MRAPCPTIAELHPYRGGCTLELRCQRCSHAFRVDQDAIGGVAFGRHPCPACAFEHELWPDDFVAAVLRAFQSDLGDTARETEQATQLAERWHRSPVFRELLCYRGVDLGPPTERELLTEISEALRRLPPEPPR